MKRIFLYSGILALLFFSFPGFAQDKAVTKALRGFDEFVEEIMKEYHVPGMAISVIKDGKVVYAKGYGFRDVENKIATDANTLFAIGSSSKAFTAFGVMKLAEEGNIKLDEPIKKHLPDFDLSVDYAEDNMTPIDILCHRSGLPRHDLVWYGSPKTRDEIFNSLSELEFSAGFRETWQYQNLMFLTAGVLIERVSGKSWEGFTRENIMDKLGMERSNFSVQALQADENASLPYAWADSSLIKMDYRDINAIGPAGSINSSVVEMAEWVKMQLNNGKYGEEELLGEAYINRMHTPQMAMGGGMDSEVFHNSYGLGWFINSYRGHKRVDHGGNIDGFSAGVTMLPMDNLGVVILTNLNGNRSLGIIRNTLFDRLLGLKEIDWNERIKSQVTSRESPENEEKPVEGTIFSHSMEDYEGSYEHVNYGEMKISLDEEQLTALFNSLELPLQHFHYDVFQWDDRILGKGKIQFHMNEKGDINKLTVSLDPTVSPIEFDKIFKEEIPLEVLESYTGIFQLGEMEASVTLDNKVLKLFIKGQPEYTLEPTSKNEFSISGLPGFSVEFDGDDMVFNQPNGVFRATRKK